MTSIIRRARVRCRSEGLHASALPLRQTVRRVGALVPRVKPRAALLLVALTLCVASAFAAEPFDLSQHRGKVVLLDFWASWCEPCRHSFPWLNEMQAKYDGRLIVIGVNVDRERGDADRFLAQVPAHFQVIYDPSGELASRYDVMGMPSSYVFDTSGTLVDRHIGFRKSKRADREAQLRKLLEPSPARASTHE